MGKVSINIDYLYEIYIDENKGKSTYTKKEFAHIIEEKIEDLIREEEF